MGFQSSFRTLRSNSFQSFYVVTNKAHFESSCNDLNLRKNYMLKVKGSKTGIFYNASFLPGHSLIFSLPTSKLEVNDETETASSQIYTGIIGKFFEKTHSNNSLFSKLGGQIFGGMTAIHIHVGWCKNISWPTRGLFKHTPLSLAYLFHLICFILKENHNYALQECAHALKYILILPSI